MAKILVVDDEPDIVYLVTKLLEKNGYTTSSAYGGKEALRKVKEEDPDLVLLDIMMPDLDGWEVSRTLKTNGDTKGLPVVMLTVRTSIDSKQKSLEYSFADIHLGKPASCNTILSTISTALNGAS